MVDDARELSVLYLEDSVQDAELVSLVLETGGVRCNIERVDTEQGFVAALGRRRFDLILSDFSMPGFDGKSGLRIARETYPDTPFIFVSGTIGEDAAIDSLTGGATDYVLKHRFSRLVPAVRRAIKEAEERRLRVDAEATLRRSEEKYRRLFVELAVPILIASQDGEVIDANPACVNLLGYPDKEEMVQLNVSRDMHAEPGQYVDLRKAVDREGQVEDVEVTLKRKDGAVLIALATVTPERGAAGGIVAYRIVWRDITGQRRLEAQFRQAQKMEAVGRLAGGIAHDFNNILTVILGYCDLFSKEALTPAQQGKIKVVRDASMRAANLTRQLLAFSRKQLLQTQVLSLNALVTQIEILMRRIMGEDVQLVTQLEPALRAVKADPGQLEQVLMNLVVNARDAMPGGGTLTIATRNMQLEPDFFGHQFRVQAGSYAMVSVEDTGTGMDSETQAQIFEPFFTTKESGKGTGLGLSTVYGIVKQSGGYIGVRSMPDAGSTFSVFLPAVEASALPVVEEAKGVAGDGAGDETILMAEDDDHVRVFAATLLRSHGYSVIEARDGLEALEVVKRYGSTIHLLLTDVIMPNLSGPGLANEAVGFRPALKVAYMSGYLESGAAADAVLSRADVVHKPFTSAHLLERVRAALDRARNEDVRSGAKVLVVEDDEALLSLLSDALAREKFNVFRATNALDARRILDREPCDLVITDLMMPYEEGIDFAVELKREAPEVKIIVISGVPAALAYIQGSELLGDVVTVAKPFTVDLLISRINSLLADRPPGPNPHR